MAPPFCESITRSGRARSCYSGVSTPFPAGLLRVQWTGESRPARAGLRRWPREGPRGALRDPSRSPKEAVELWYRAGGWGGTGGGGEHCGRGRTVRGERGRGRSRGELRRGLPGGGLPQDEERLWGGDSRAEVPPPPCRPGSGVGKAALSAAPLRVWGWGRRLRPAGCGGPGGAAWACGVEARLRGGVGAAGAGAPGGESAHLAAGARLRLIHSHCPQLSGRGKARGVPAGPCLRRSVRPPAGSGGVAGALGRSRGSKGCRSPPEVYGKGGARSPGLDLSFFRSKLLWHGTFCSGEFPLSPTSPAAGLFALRLTAFSC